MKKSASPLSTLIPSAADVQAKGTITAKKKGNVKKPWVSATFYIPRPTHKRLRDYASAHDTSLQQILEEAADLWLASKHEQPFYPEGWSDEIGKKDVEE
jgi:hypothetical protein